MGYVEIGGHVLGSTVDRVDALACEVRNAAPPSTRVATFRDRITVHNRGPYVLRITMPPPSTCEVSLIYGDTRSGVSRQTAALDTFTDGSIREKAVKTIRYLTPQQVLRQLLITGNREAFNAFSHRARSAA